MFLGQYIEAERLRMDLSRAELASLAGFKHANSIYEIERMGQDVPRGKLVAILDALQVQEVNRLPVFTMEVGRVAEYRDTTPVESER